jgi:ribosomal protein S18 acetylase RimI-like enzyme
MSSRTLRITPWPLNRFDEIWPIIEEVAEGEDTYALPGKLSREEALKLWTEPGRRVYAALFNDEICGTYYLRPNQPGPGDHVANAGFMVPSKSRGAGVARLMGEHALAEAKRLGYRSMQFNFVVSTNTPAIRLWRSLGFEVVGTLPNAFRHRQIGLVDAYVMYREL